MCSARSDPNLNEVTTFVIHQDSSDRGVRVSYRLSLLTSEKASYKNILIYLLRITEILVIDSDQTVTGAKQRHQVNSITYVYDGEVAYVIWM